MFRQTHPPIWDFINTLKLDESHNWMLLAQILAGEALSQQKTVYRDVNARIATLVQALHKKIKFSIKNFFSKCDQIR